MLKKVLIMSLVLSPALSFFPSCSTTTKKANREYTPQELFEAACTGEFASASKTTEVKGSVWIKMDTVSDSGGSRGQFPASVRVLEGPKLGGKAESRAHPELTIEVTNLIGAPQAWILIRDQKVKIKLTPENEKKWGKNIKKMNFSGLPLRFAPDLFLGRVPCPSPEASPQFSLIADKGENEGGEMPQIEVRVESKNGAELYRYEFLIYEERPWVSRVVFVGKGLRADFSFSDPFYPDRAAKSWSASSEFFGKNEIFGKQKGEKLENGKLDLKWKDRVFDLYKEN